MVPAGEAHRWRPPWVWRALMVGARAVVGVTCRLRVTGALPASLRGRPLILAVNHIGPFDPIVFTAACRVRRLAPRMMATGGLFDAPVAGPVVRAAGMIRVNRHTPSVGDALDAARTALETGSVVAVYPEGRIGLDPGMWPEQGKTGPARLALATGVPVVPVAQWGAHEVMVYHGWRTMIARLCRAVAVRPVVRVHFGAPVDLSDLAPQARGAAQRATDRIMDALTAELAAVRRDEPRLPRYVDPTRPLSTARRHVRTGGPTGPRSVGGLVAAQSQVGEDGLAGGADPEGLPGLGDAPVGGP